VSDGRLTDAELEAIRGRAEATKKAKARYPDLSPSVDEKDRERLLRALDAALADLAAAEGALFDLTSPQSGEANAAYLRGAEDERRRCVAELRAEVTRLREMAGDGSSFAHAETRELCLLRAVTVEMLARRVESPPAPAAAPGGE
jgi:plasmid stabilization system protein ParE